MDYSPIGKLSPELRNMIYELVVGNAHVKISCDWHRTSDYSPKKPVISGLQRNHLALTKTCKQIRVESISYFYSTSAFTITVAPSVDDRRSSRSQVALLHLHASLNSIGPKHARMMKTVDLAITFFDTRAIYRDTKILAQFASFLHHAGASTSIRLTSEDTMERYHCPWISTSVHDIAAQRKDSLDQEWWHRNYNKWMDALSPEEREEAPTDTCREILLKFVMKMRAELKKEDNGLFQ